MAAVRPYFILLVTLICVFTTFSQGLARTSLVALPERFSTVVRLNDGHLTLVQEKRVLSLKKGVNQIDFSWQHVRINKESIQLTALTPENDVAVLSVSFPPGESALIWNVYSGTRIELEVMISYLLSGIDGLSVYTALADTDETRVTHKTQMVLRNFSGENFDPAYFTINGSGKFKTALDHLETKRILIDRQDGVPIKKTVVWKSADMPHEPKLERQAVGIPVFYEIANRKTSGMGIRPIFSGKTRVFQTDTEKSTIFLGEDRTPYTPVGDMSRIKIGESRDIVVTRRVMGTRRVNIRKNNKGKVQVWDEIVDLQLIVENLKDKPSEIEIIESFNGEWEPLNFTETYELQDNNTVKVALTLSENEKKTLKLNYKVLNIFSGTFSRFNTARF